MAKIIGFATADWHSPEEATGRSWKTVPDARGDVIFAVEQCVELCRRNDVPLLAAGDNFDGPDPEPAAVAALYDALRPLNDAGVALYYVLGNHDRGRDWLAPLGAWAVRLDNRIAQLPGGFDATGLSYAPGPQFAALVANVAPTAVGLYHQTWSELIGAGRDRISCATLPNHQLAVGGDVHVHALLAPERGPKKFLSPGPLIPQSVAEFAGLGTPRVYAIHDDMSVVPYAIRGRRVSVVDADDAEAALAAVTNAEPTDDLPDAIARPIVVVRLRESQPEFEAALVEAAQRSRCLLRLYRGTATKESAATVVSAVSLASAIAAWPADDAARQLAQQLAAPNADPDAILRAARAEHESDLEPEDCDETTPY